MKEMIIIWTILLSIGPILFCKIFFFIYYKIITKRSQLWISKWEASHNETIDDLVNKKKSDVNMISKLSRHIAYMFVVLCTISTIGVSISMYLSEYRTIIYFLPAPCIMLSAYVCILLTKRMVIYEIDYLNKLRTNHCNMH